MPRPSRLLPNPLNLGGLSFGQRLALLRKDRGLTQAGLAEKIGLTPPLVSHYEKDRLRPHGDLVARFALALECSADELLGLTQRPSEGRESAKSRRLLRRLQQIERLPRRDQDALFRTIDGFLASRGLDKDGAAALFAGRRRGRALQAWATPVSARTGWIAMDD